MNNKVTYTAEQVKALAHCLQHISLYSYPTPAYVVCLLNGLSRETLFQLAKELHIRRGTTTTRDELVRMIIEQYNTNYWEAIRTPKVYARG